ncbi:MAG: cation diffusion facilitator family transporter [Rhizobacter sp.]|nr:cation diffusion facilitator family transporter [Rhizobacter sp.]
MRAFNRWHRRLATHIETPGGVRAVVLGFLGAGAFATAKTIAAVLTGSAAMLAETVHSWVSLGAEIFLVGAYLLARRPRDALHPLGYGRESYVWSLFASIGIFVVGSGVAIWRGLHQLSVGDDRIADYGIGYLVLAGAFAFQAWSFRLALSFVRERAATRDAGVFEHLFRSSDSQLRAVVTGDFMALLGTAAAAVGMALHQWSGRVAWDALGSIVIGLLMATAGLYLIDVNRRYLAGVPLSHERSAQVVAQMLQRPEIERVTFFFAEYVGPERVLVVARVALRGDGGQAELGRALRRLERRFTENPAVVAAIVTLSSPEEPDWS